MTRRTFDRDTGGGRCFACGRRLSGHDTNMAQVKGERREVYVDLACSRLIREAGAEGYQPPKGGPRLVSYEHWTR